jgi:leucyl aminopeptidase
MRSSRNAGRSRHADGSGTTALGPDLPPFYTNDETLASDVALARQENDPCAHAAVAGLRFRLDSKVANVTNAPSGAFAGSIVCALFLQRFVEAATSWLHVDIYGWTPSAKPGRPKAANARPHARSKAPERALWLIRA